VNSETRIYDVLQAAVTVIWCISIVVLFVDVLIILRRYRAQFDQRRIAHPAMFWINIISLAIASVLYVLGRRTSAPTRGLHRAGRAVMPPTEP